MVKERAPLEEETQKLDVLVSSTQLQPTEYDNYKRVSTDIVERIQHLAEEKPDAERQTAAFNSEYLFSKTFENKIELHKRLVNLEKQSVKENFPRDIRLKIVNLLMESALECGDFLLINGLIYKTQKDLPLLSPLQRREFLPKYLELCTIYHFYENDLSLAQKEISELLQLEDIEEDVMLRYYFHKIGILIAANLPRTANETIQELMLRFPKLENEISIKLMELVVTVGMNMKEEALNKMQRFRSLIRKHPDARRMAHYRQFLDLLQKFLLKKPVQWQEIPAFETDWNELFKLNLWFKAKVENSFYYNSILNDWQAQKKILHF
jgi:hypothetical protein